MRLLSLLVLSFLLVSPLSYGAEIGRGSISADDRNFNFDAIGNVLGIPLGSGQGAENDSDVDDQDDESNDSEVEDDAEDSEDIENENGEDDLPALETDEGEPLDTDKDGLPNDVELEIDYNPHRMDSDDDGIKDGVEICLILEFPDVAETIVADVQDIIARSNIDCDELLDDNSYILDFDGDGLTNGREKDLGTDIEDVDSDDDGLADGLEVDCFSTNPNNKDTDGDGKSDFEEVKGSIDNCTALFNIGSTSPSIDSDTNTPNETLNADGDGGGCSLNRGEGYGAQVSYTLFAFVGLILLGLRKQSQI